ncbi:DUF4251 domain-containing protein [Chitinophaga sp. SYP-B3965]|uniref:DUF4251 domain-containing protein n=1 Tax=Chitinophaga sp. SYP-B3965 TaxID=2663120 RepID=UPI001299AC23|nr:DUF4251 domain-containing protein [Chitinophaga sp. SYP-B3965]MRG45113.1 DUF4251 domain-containing protein [Chitinophaga sp. SYP-B3965]
MKYIKTIPVLLLLLILGGGSFAQTSAKPKESEKAKKIKELISNRNYVFQAQTVFPMSGRTRQITGEGYDVTVSKDTVNSYLPYFGRAYSAPIDPSKSGLQFISKNFEYTEAPGKKGGWDITIKPKDIQDVQQLFLSVSTDGYASLQVTSTNRQAISFNGTIVEKRVRKKK